MRLHRDQLPTRISGTLLGAGFIAIGLFSALGSSQVADPVAGDRALWFGITAIIGGAIATVCSWVAGDLSGIWCRHPPRPWNRRRPGP